MQKKVLYKHKSINKDMHETIKKDIVSVLSKLIGILSVKGEKDIIEVRELSNHTIHNASVFQDEDSISIAILTYSLSKIIERKQGELNYNNIVTLLKDAIDYLTKNNIDGYRETIRKMFNFISTIDTKLKLYIEEVINQAQIKKGGKLYAHGISIARAAEILGISQWELMNYIGKTKIVDRFEEELNVKNRLSFARGLFR